MSLASNPAPSLGHSNNLHLCWILPNRWTQFSIGVSSTSEVMGCYTRKRRPSSLYLPNRRMLVIDESVFHPIRRTPAGSMASDPTLHGSAGQLRSFGSPKLEGRDYVRRTTQYGCQPLSHASSSKNNVAARVLCGCLVPAPWQGQACRLGLSTRNFGVVPGCCPGTNYMNSMYLLESWNRYIDI